MAVGKSITLSQQKTKGLIYFGSFSIGLHFSSVEKCFACVQTGCPYFPFVSNTLRPRFFFGEIPESAFYETKSKRNSTSRSGPTIVCAKTNLFAWVSSTQFTKPPDQ